jgi:hypothetical protein
VPHAHARAVATGRAVGVGVGVGAAWQAGSERARRGVVVLIFSTH